MLKLMRIVWNDYLRHGFHPVFAPLYAAIGGCDALFTLQSWLANGVIDWPGLMVAIGMMGISFYLAIKASMMVEPKEGESPELKKAP